MGIQLGNILQIRLRGALLSEVFENVYYYRATTSWDFDGDYAALSAAFLGNLVSDVAAVMSNSAGFSGLEVRNLTNQLDIYQQAVNIAGSAAGQPLPPYITWTVKLLRSTLLTRNGSKRYSGLNEEQVSNGGIGFTQSQINAIEESHAADLSYSSGGIFYYAEPVIVGRFPQGTPNAGQLDLSKINPIQAAAIGFFSTSQNTRKKRQIY